MATFSRRGGTDLAESPEQDSILAAPVSTMAASQVAEFPSVNLIPDEIAEEARVRRAKLVLGGAIAASIVAVGGLFLVATGEVGSAQESLDSATARGAGLSAEAAKYADVPKVKADLASAQSQQSLALGREVRWSFVLNNLALTLPAGSSLSTFKGTLAEPGAAGAAPGANGVRSVLGNSGIGGLTFDGEALDNAKVAAFLEALTRNTGVVDPFATTLTNDAASADSVTSAAATKALVKFSATATLGDKALSHRYDVKGS